MNEACNSTFCPASEAHGGSKGQIQSIIKFQLQFQRVLYQTLCVLSQMKLIKHIGPDFHSVAWNMPQGGTWGAWGHFFRIRS